MIIEIDNDYIQWLKGENPELSDEDISNYINEVLFKHRKSWEIDENNI